MIWEYIQTQSREISNQIYTEIMHIRQVTFWKEQKWKLLKGDGMVIEWHWIMTDCSLKCSSLSVDWIVTKKSLNGAFQCSRKGGITSCGNQKLYPTCWSNVLPIESQRRCILHKTCICTRNHMVYDKVLSLFNEFCVFYHWTLAKELNTPNELNEHHIEPQIIEQS